MKQDKINLIKQEIAVLNQKYKESGKVQLLGWIKDLHKQLIKLENDN